MSWFKKKKQEPSLLVKQGQRRTEREREAKQTEQNVKREKELEQKRKDFDKTPRPTFQKLKDMEMHEHLPLLEYVPMTGAKDEPGMVRVGTVLRVPGGWLYRLFPLYMKLDEPGRDAVLFVKWNEKR